MNPPRNSRQPIEVADLAECLNLGAHNHVSLVGGGGKTTLLFALADQLAGTIVLTTTTKMGLSRTEAHAVLIDPTDGELRDVLELERRALVWQETDEHKAVGVSPERCDHWFKQCCDHLIVEADGSRRRPFKAPADYEPVIAPSTTAVISCIGSSALGIPISTGCHRPELVAELAQCGLDDPLTPVRAAAVLAHREGGRRNVPEGARHVVAINRVTEPTDDAFALADALIDVNIDVVCVAERQMG